MLDLDAKINSYLVKPEPPVEVKSVRPGQVDQWKRKHWHVIGQSVVWGDVWVYMVQDNFFSQKKGQRSAV